VNVSAAQVIRRGMDCRCPNCGGKTLFKAGKAFAVNPVCPDCGLKFEKGEGAFLGPLVLNYGVTVFGFVLPLVALCVAGKLNLAPTLILAAAAAFLLPLAFYRWSWGWWLTLYYLFLRDNLPANRGEVPEDDE
jgi:uncharacterized protein (DUF983 family)